MRPVEGVLRRPVEGVLRVRPVERNGDASGGVHVGAFSEGLLEVSSCLGVGGEVDLPPAATGINFNRALECDISDLWRMLAALVLNFVVETGRF